MVTQNGGSVFEKTKKKKKKKKQQKKKKIQPKHEKPLCGATRQAQQTLLHGAAVTLLALYPSNVLATVWRTLRRNALGSSRHCFCGTRMGRGKGTSMKRAAEDMQTW